MLRTDKDRLSYSEALKPPEGYFLERAVATTYSLDLETLIAAAIPLGLSENIDNLLRESPVCLLEALRRISKKLLVFCEAGQIKWPMKSNPLYGFLEDMIVEVKLPYHERGFCASKLKTESESIVSLFSAAISQPTIAGTYPLLLMEP